MNSVRDWRGTPQGCSGAQRRNDNPGKPDRRLRRERPNEKNNRSIYAEYWWNYKIIAKHYAERSRSFGGCAASRAAGVDAYP